MDGGSGAPRHSRGHRQVIAAQAWRRRSSTPSASRRSWWFDVPIVSPRRRSLGAPPGAGSALGDRVGCGCVCVPVPERLDVHQPSGLREIGERRCNDSRRPVIGRPGPAAAAPELSPAARRPRRSDIGCEDASWRSSASDRIMQRSSPPETLQGDPQQLGIAQPLDRNGIVAAQGRHWRHAAVATSSATRDLLRRGSRGRDRRSGAMRRSSMPFGGPGDRPLAGRGQPTLQRRHQHRPVLTSCARGLLRCREWGEPIGSPHRSMESAESCRCVSLSLRPRACSVPPCARARG